MDFTYQILVFATGCIFMLVSGVFLNNSKKWLTPLFLFLSAMCLFFVAATLDDFLHMWDERYHALVAKNMMDFPFKPMLYKDMALEQDYSGWYKGHIWIHKQPLFMWQMALSMKVFGVSVLASRIPSVLMSSFLVLALFRSGNILHSRKTGFFAAIFMLTSYYWFGLVAGRNMLDTNDVAFISYVGLSFWAWLEYEKSKKWWWIPIIGLLSGTAILCKWLTGLLVFAGWGIHLMLKKELFTKHILPLTIAVSVCVAVFLPWQIYTAHRFPVEFAAEQAHNLEHLFEPLSFNKQGDYFFYIHKIRENYSVGSALFLLIALIVFYFINQHRNIARSLLAAFMLQFLFFSLAESKMPSFALAGWFVACLSFGYLLSLLFSLFIKIKIFGRYQQLLLSVAIAFLVVSRFDFTNLNSQKENKTNPDHHTYKMLHNKRVMSSIDLPSDYVIFNINGLHIVEAMFYTDNPVYNGFPKNEQIEELRKKGRKIAVLKGENDLPKFLIDTSGVLILNKKTFISE